MRSSLRGLLGRASARPVMAVAVSAAMFLAAGGLATAGVLWIGGSFGTHRVGDQDSAGRILLPDNQWISPVGKRITVDNGRLLSSTLSPDGTQLATLSWQNFTAYVSIIDVQSGKVLQQLGTGSQTDPVLGDGTVSPDGPLYSPDGKTLWVGQSNDLLRLTVAADGTISALVVIKLTGAHGAALPSGMALSADATTLYVALNGSNTLGVIDTATNQLVKEIPVGNAPRQVVLDGDHAFVSNEGGRPATANDFTNLSDGTPVVSDAQTGAATTGTLSVVDLASQAQSDTIPVGLQPTALYLAGHCSWWPTPTTTASR